MMLQRYVGALPETEIQCVVEEYVDRFEVKSVYRERVAATLARHHDELVTQFYERGWATAFTSHRDAQGRSYPPRSGATSVNSVCGSNSPRGSACSSWGAAPEDRCGIWGRTSSASWRPSDWRRRGLARSTTCGGSRSGHWSTPGAKASSPSFFWVARKPG
jgi:hypothetical protein